MEATRNVHTYRADFLEGLQRHLSHTTGIHVLTPPETYGALHIYCTNETQMFLVSCFCEKHGYTILHQTDGHRSWIAVIGEF